MREVSAFWIRPCLAVAVLAGGTAAAEGPPDLKEVDRRLGKEPAYQAEQPLYGLYVFGPGARTRIWAVLDKSKPDAPDHDVLYFDRNADGDLTGADERIQGRPGEGGITFSIGNFTDPVSRQQHTGLSLSHRGGKDGRTMLRMEWCGKVTVRGGYAPTAGPYTQFAPTPAEAPVLWPGADGPFSFQPWMLEALAVGGTTDVRVFLGQRGHGQNTFCAVPDTFLPKKVPVLATLVYRDRDGKERRVQAELRERC